ATLRSPRPSFLACSAKNAPTIGGSQVTPIGRVQLGGAAALSRANRVAVTSRLSTTAVAIQWLPSRRAVASPTARPAVPRSRQAPPPQERRRDGRHLREDHDPVQPGGHAGSIQSMEANS